MKVLLIHDIELKTPKGRIGWAYSERTRCLARYAPDDIKITRCSDCEVNWERACEYDLIVAVDYALALAYKSRMAQLKCETPLVICFNKDSRSRQLEWKHVVKSADYIIVNNIEKWETAGKLPKTCCISNGVDVQFWTPAAPVDDRADTVLWCGGIGPKKMKGYHELIVPLCLRLPIFGFSHSVRPVTRIEETQVLTRDEQRDWYGTGGYVICPSRTEGGGPNFVMEGMACGCVPVCSPVGGIPEYIQDRVNGILVYDRSVDGFMKALITAQKTRTELAEEAVKSMQAWRYDGDDGRAQWFYQLFRRIMKDGCDSVEPFCWREKHWSEI